MKRIYLILALTITGLSYPQSQFQEFINYVNSLTDSLDKAAAIDSFMIVAREQGIPFIEDSTANFIYLGTPNTVTVPGDFNGWDPNSHSMTNLTQTNFWYYSANFEMNARLDYKFVLNGSNWILDPENPNTILGGFGPNSELAMPEYVQPWEIEFNPNIAHGTVEDISIFSNHLNDTYQLKIYLPPGYTISSSTLYPAVYFQDGFEYIDLASAVNVLDNLLDSIIIDPLISIFVKPNDRNEEYAFIKRNQYRLFFIEELVPFVDSIYNTIPDAENRLVLGPSFGGNISALIAYNHPDVFGTCGIQSGAFWPNNFEVYNMIINGPIEDITWSSIWGSYEGLAENMRDFRDFLLTNNYELDWLVLPEGHSWGLWRSTIDRMLKYVFPSTTTGVEDEETHLPEIFPLYQNYPNPFNPTTKIKFRTEDTGFVSLKVYDILSNEIATLVNNIKPAGAHEIIFNAAGLSSGVYFYTLQAGKHIETRKMTLLH